MGTSRFAARVAAATLACFAAPTATASAAAPLTIVKSFGKVVAHRDVPVRLTYTIGNTNHLGGASVAGVGFSDHLPAGLVVAASSPAENGCGGTLDAAAGDSTVKLTGADTLPAGAVCLVSLDVRGILAGVKTSATTVTSSGGSGNTSSASLLVVDTPPLTGGPPVREYLTGVTPGLTGSGEAIGITAGADGNVWFAESGWDLMSASGGGAIARVNVDSGDVTEFEAGSTPGFTPFHVVQHVASGPDGRIWYSEHFDPGAIGRLADDGGSATELTGGTTTGFTSGRYPNALAAGTDGNVWFTEDDAVAHTNANGSVTEIPLAASPLGVTAAPDGDMWFADWQPAGITRVAPDGTARTFAAGTTPGFLEASFPHDIATGPDGRIWFTQQSAIGRLDDDGTVTEYADGTTPGLDANAFPDAITAGPDGNIWFTTYDSVDRLNPDGTVSEFKAQVTPGFGGGADDITTGPDGNVWFTERDVPGGVARIAPQTPGIATGTAATTDVTGEEELTATLNPAGLTVTDCHFEYTDGGGQPLNVPCARAPGGGTSTVDVSARVRGLRPGTSYDFRLVAGNAAATNASAVTSFTTPAAPTVATNAASDVGPRAATLLGSLDPHGANATDCRFEYGTTTAYGHVAACAQRTAGATAPVEVSARIGGLRPGTTYHVRLVGTAFGTTRGADRSFSTVPGPDAMTGAASAIGAHTATLTGSVDADGATVTDCRFEYGPGASSPAVAPCAQQVGGGTGVVAVSAAIHGLRAGTTYRFRLVVTNAIDTAAGGYRVFTTTASQPPVLSSVALRPKRFAVRRHGGAHLAFRLSEPARLAITVARVRHRHARRVGRLVVNAAAGAHRRRFSGRIGRRALRPGRYRATLVATDAAGERSAARHLRFRIVHR